MLGSFHQTPKAEFVFIFYINELAFTSLLGGAVTRVVRSPPDPDCSLHVDRRLRALPYRREASEGPVSLPPGRCPLHHALCPARRLHARTAPGNRGRSAAKAAGLGRAPGAG